MISRGWRPARPDPEHRKCYVCERVFAAGGVPAPMAAGPYAGELVCRDCRRLVEDAALPFPPAPPR